MLKALYLNYLRSFQFKIISILISCLSILIFSSLQSLINYILTQITINFITFHLSNFNNSHVKSQYLHSLTNFTALFFIHLFAFITHIGMPIFDLINNFTSKYSQVFSSFLQAYSDIRQMKNIPQNLLIISQCLLTEYSQGSSKCLNYYISHDIDKILLQLNEQDNLESFYCSIIHLVTETYLNSEFFIEAWKYKKFFKLAKMYGEKCVSLKIFNSAYAHSLIESFPSSKNSIVILCEVDEYLKFFKDSNVGEMAVKQVNLAIQMRMYEVIELIEFLVYFEDKSAMDFLSKVEIKNIDLNELIDIGKDIPKTDDENQKIIVNDSYNAEFGYFFLIFKQIKSVKIRQKVLEFIPYMVESGLIGLKGCVELVVECIKIDCISVATALNRHESSSWVPLEILDLMHKNNLIFDIQSHALGKIRSDIETSYSLTTEYSNNEIKQVDCNKQDIENSTQTIILEAPSDNQVNNELFKTLFVIMKDERLVSICRKWKYKNSKFFKNSKLLDLLITKAVDSRIFAFLLFVNDTLVLNNLRQILENVDDKESFCKLIYFYQSKIFE